MKTTRNLFFAFIAVLSFYGATAQENRFIIGGGYAFANIEDTDVRATGYRINGLFEYNPNEGSWAHGFSIGYIGLSGSTDNIQSAEYKTNSWPIYYAPKVMFGKNSFKAYMKGALGMHFSNYKRTGSAADVKVNDIGFYGGLSAGLSKDLGESAFLVLDYEWAYLSNSYLNDGFLNTINLGLGFKF